MSVIAQAQFTRPEEIVEYFKTDFENNAGSLGIEFVGGYNERLLPRYPAIVVSAGGVDKELHGTHTFLMRIRVFVYVYHAQMRLNDVKRSLADLQLATAVMEFMERDMTLGDRIIQGWVESEFPGARQVNSDKGQVVVSTRLTWMGISERRF
jgi:hypothetical protein